MRVPPLIFERRVLVGTGHPLGDRLLRPEVVTRGEDRAGATEDHHAHGVVGLGLEEGFVELDQQAPVLGVAALDAVQHDPGDRAVVEGLVADVLVIRHRIPSSVQRFGLFDGVEGTVCCGST